MSNYYYDEADIPITVPLLKVIIKRSWAGKDGNVKRPSLLNAIEWLSPFAMLDLDEDEIALLNDKDGLI